MSTDRPGTGPTSDVPDDDVVVPHPFGSVARAQPPAAIDPEDAEPETAEPEAAEPQAAEPQDAEPQDAEPQDAEQAAIEPEGAEDVESEVESEVEESAAATAAAGEERPADTPADTPAAAASRRKRDPLAAALIGVLTLLLGFAFAVQVRSVGDDQAFSTAREEDLVRILDSLNAREERLREQISDQRSALQQLSSSDSQLATALEEARARAEAIGILNGTIAARGPGLVMTVHDPEDAIRVADVLDAIQELRGAGAETMQIDDVRIGVSSAVTGDPGDLMIDGRPITAPYEFLVIGSPQNMRTAMNIPGGVVPRFTNRGGSVDIRQPDEVVVDALRPLDTPQYAQPDTGD
jgi:uncharacterized protein YlxW (UPF0749 family)